MEDESVIKRQMEDSRTALGEKLETLEQHVAHTVQGAAEAVNGTVEAIKDTVTTVKDSVEGTVTAVKGTVEDSVATVRDWLDIRAHVERCPWTMTGSAVVAGFLLGRFLSKARTTLSPAPDDRRSAEGPRNGNGYRMHGPPPSRPKRRHEHSEPSLLTEFGPELTDLKRLALGALFGTAREMIVKAVPAEVGQTLGTIVDNVTTKLGGQPLANVDWVGGTPSTGDTHEHGDEAEMGRPMGAAHRQSKKTLGDFD